MIPKSTRYKVVETETRYIKYEGSKREMLRIVRQINKTMPQHVFLALSSKTVNETF